MRNLLAPLVAALAVAAAAPQGAPAATPAAAARITLAQVPPEQAPLSDVDLAFIQQAAEAAAADLRLGELAVDRAKSARVQDFARAVAEERAEANERLAQLALAKGVPLSGEPTAEQRHVIDEMDELAGSEFDVAYMAHQVGAYEDEAALYRTQLDQTEDPDLRAFAEASLATLEDSLEAARELDEQVRAAAN